MENERNNCAYTFTFQLRDEQVTGSLYPLPPSKLVKRAAWLIFVDKKGWDEWRIKEITW